MKENTSALHVQLPVDVATYLLNEKRAEIYDIEVRQKINIILIPNIHIETPAYNVTRIRHEDVKSHENVVSYKLVEKNAEETNPVVSEHKNKPTRPQAAVHGITPSQPAPMREDKSRDTSLLDKFFSWFKPSSGNEEIKSVVNERPQATIEKIETSQERNRSRGRRTRNRGDRSNKPNKQRLDVADTNSETEQPVLSDTHGQLQYEYNALELPTATKTEKLAIEEISAIEKTNPDEPNTKANVRKRTRRQRGNRQRDQSSQEKKQIDNQSIEIDATIDDIYSRTNDASDFVTDNVSQNPIDETLIPIAVGKKTGRKATSETILHDQSETKPSFKQEPEFTPSIKKLPDLTKVGLIMVETPPEKVAATSEEVVTPKRSRRKVKETVTVSSEPLMQIETRE